MQVGVDKLGHSRNQSVSYCSVIQAGFAGAVRTRQQIENGLRHAQAAFLAIKFRERLSSTTSRTRLARLPLASACAKRASMSSSVWLRRALRVAASYPAIAACASC